MCSVSKRLNIRRIIKLFVLFCSWLINDGVSRHRHVFSCFGPDSVLSYCTQWTAESSVFGAVSLWFFCLYMKYPGNRWTDLRQTNSHGRRVWSSLGRVWRSRSKVKMTRDKNGTFRPFRHVGRNFSHSHYFGYWLSRHLVAYHRTVLPYKPWYSHTRSRTVVAGAISHLLGKQPGCDVSTVGCHYFPFGPRLLSSFRTWPHLAFTSWYKCKCRKSLHFVHNCVNSEIIASDPWKIAITEGDITHHHHRRLRFNGRFRGKPGLVGFFRLSCLPPLVAGCCAFLRQLRSIQRSVPCFVFQILVVAVVLSRVGYGNATLAGLPANLLNRLQSVLNASARSIAGLRHSAHITDNLASYGRPM